VKNRILGSILAGALCSLSAVAHAASIDFAAVPESTVQFGFDWAFGTGSGTATISGTIHVDLAGGRPVA
jgi:hypothetical protein